jgi:hypothetical protein
MTFLTAPAKRATTLPSLRCAAAPFVSDDTRSDQSVLMMKLERWTGTRLQRVAATWLVGLAGLPLHVRRVIPPAAVQRYTMVNHIPTAGSGCLTCGRTRVRLPKRCLRGRAPNDPASPVTPAGIAGRLKTASGVSRRVSRSLAVCNSERAPSGVSRRLSGL